MCAKKVMVTRAHQTGQPIVLEDDLDDETALKVLRKKMTWRDWVIYDFMRYVYGLTALSLAAFMVSEISREYHVKDTLGIAALGIGGFAVVVVEFLIYKMIWPQGAFTKGRPFRKSLRNAIRRIRWRV